jgi:hypothetical protein
MSYLNALRLHFAGQFQSNISTVNNDPAHFYNAIFTPDDQKMQGPGMVPPNGWFNPQGDAAFRLLGCKVTAAWMPSGQVSFPDMVVSYVVTDSDRQAPAKLVDLDSEQQLASEIWGLQVRIADEQGNTLMRGDFTAAAFMDIWSRTPGNAGSDINAGAMYQSVLTNLWWGDLAASPFLTALQQAAGDGLLSIKFNVDGLSMDFRAPDFMCGRIAGTIGPAAADEPRFMVIGRQFMASCPPSPGFPFPTGQINFFAGVVDDEAGCIFLDLGNALPTTSTGGPMVNLGDLTLNVSDPAEPSVNPLGTIPQGEYTDPDWYAETAGVVALPLSAAQLQAVASAQLVLTGNQGVNVSEWGSGAFVRADRFVYRMSPNEKVEIPVYATQWGRPLAGADISFEADPSQLQAQMLSGTNENIPVATPADALQFFATATTDADGRAVLTVNTTDPGTPRYFNNGADYGIDGQVYGIRPAFDNAAQFGGPVNQWNFISILLWSGFTPSNPVTWADLQPTFQQYANLYPVMSRFLDLSSYDDVKANADLLQLAFGLDARNPNAMPVTRDLSPAKRSAILTWLKNPLPAPGGWQPETAAPAASKATAVAPAAAAAAAVAHKGGKAAALARRVILQKK